MKILLIEPDNLLAEIYVRVLKEEGHTILRVSSAQAAITQADKLSPDIVILELQLPFHNGIEFLYEFRSYSEWQKIPVIINTFADIRKIFISSSLGVSKLLYKPNTSLRQLLRAVNYAISVTS